MDLIYRNLDLIDKISTYLDNKNKSQVSEKINKINKIYPEYVVIGNGISGLYNYILRKKHKKNILVIAFDEGNWTDVKYTLAQRFSTLYCPEFNPNVRDISVKSRVESDDYVNASEMKKMMQANRKGINFLKGKVVKLTRSKDNSIWVIDVVLPGVEQPIQVKAKFVDLCVGLGTAIPITDMGMENVIPDMMTILAENSDVLRIVNANNYVLNDTYCSDTSKKIIVYGGGGSSSAAFRRALLNNDNNVLLKDVKNPKNEVWWMARGSLRGSGKGDLVLDSIEYAEKNKLLFKDHEIKKVDWDPETKKMKITFITKGMDVQFENIDQFVYGIGQNDMGTPDFPGATRLCKDIPLSINYSVIDKCPSEHVPVCIKDESGTLNIHGASASTFCKIKSKIEPVACKKLKQVKGKKVTFTEQAQEKSLDTFPEDNKYCGTMPGMFAFMRLLFAKNYPKDVTEININSDTLQLMYIFSDNVSSTKEQNINLKKFFKFIVKNRRSTECTCGYNDSKIIEKLINDYKLEDIISVKYKCIITSK